MLLAMLSAKTAEDQVGLLFVAFSFFFFSLLLTFLDLSASVLNGFAPSDGA